MRVFFTLALLSLRLASAWADDADAAKGSDADAKPVEDDSQVPIGDDIAKLRDPFKMPDIGSGQVEVMSDLFKFPLEEFKMIGIVTGPEKLRAMVRAPNGRTFFVSELSKIGSRNGTIEKITTNSMSVKEKITNILGREENVISELRLASLSKNPDQNKSAFETKLETGPDAVTTTEPPPTKAPAKPANSASPGTPPSPPSPPAAKGAAAPAQGSPPK